MRILAIETSTMLGGVAIMDEAGLVAESRLNVKAAHSERLMAEIDRALRSSGLGLRDLDAIAVSSGPGSFTGLRIGISTAKGLAFATGLPVAAVPTLEAFAWEVPFSRHPVCPLLDARKRQVYAGAFLFVGGAMKRVIAEAPVNPDDFIAALGETEGAVFAGEGAAMYREKITAALGQRAHFAPPHLAVPSPSAVAFLGLKIALAGGFADPSSLAPFYMRKSEAELKSG